MILTSILGMRAAESRNYWPVLLASFMALPIRGGLAFFPHGMVGHRARANPRRDRRRPAERGGTGNGGPLTQRHRPGQSRTKAL
jgi:hypothetical protein